MQLFPLVPTELFSPLMEAPQKFGLQRGRSNRRKYIKTYAAEI